MRGGSLISFKSEALLLIRNWIEILIYVERPLIIESKATSIFSMFADKNSIVLHKSVILQKQKQCVTVVKEMLTMSRLVFQCVVKYY